MQAPAKQVVLTNTKNKIQLNAMITYGILNLCYFTEATQTHTITIAGVRDVPVETTGGLRIDRHGLYSTHEEADILIAQHAISYLLLSSAYILATAPVYDPTELSRANRVATVQRPLRRLSHVHCHDPIQT